MNQSNSAKKLKQSRLPFSPLTSPSGSTTIPVKISEVSSPKTPVVARKRKPSSDPEVLRSNKIGRKSSKENIATEQDVVEIIDSESEQGQSPIIITNETSSEIDGDPLHIKLPFSTKKKTNSDAKQPQKSVEEEEEDDSIVYLDKEDLKSQKKPKKTTKKKKKTTDTEETPIVNVVENEKVDIPEEMEIDITATDEKIPDSHECSPKSFDTIPSTKVSPEKNDDDEQEEFNDEIADVLTDFSEDLNASSVSTKESNPTNTTTSSNFDITKLTPKQLARRQEFENRRLEKERKKQQERELREQQRLKEKEIREDAKRKEREEKEEARRKEKEDRDRKKQAELDKKEQERKQKEEERKKLQDQRDEEKRQKEEERKRQIELKDEERRQKEEEKRKKELEEENKKKKAAENFSKFFVAKKKQEPVVIEDDGSKEGSNLSDGIPKQNFMPFQIRERMKLAPIVRFQLPKERKLLLEEILLENSMAKSKTYLDQLKTGAHKPMKTDSTWPADDEELMIVDELEGVGEDILTDETQMKTKLKAKFFMFTENRRPAFKGTWQKKTSIIKPRNPFAKDEKFFDYEIDSDDEWEEEEPGESLHGSDSEKEKEEKDEDDYVEDFEFFVPHGHLSDEEIKQMDDDDEDNSPEAQKAKIKIMQQEFAEEMKKKTEKIKPRLIGCFWMNGDEDENGKTNSNNESKYHCSDIIWRLLKAREAWTNEETIEVVDENEVDVVESEDEAPKTTKTPQPKQPVRAKFNDIILRDLIRLVHGNVNSKKFIIKEFQAYRLKNFHKTADFLELTVKSVEEKFSEICEYKSCPEEGPMFGKKCWYVKESFILELFGDEKLKLPNEWNYTLEKEIKEKKVKTTSPPKEEDNSNKKPTSTPTTPSQPAKKRVKLLMSVPLGESVNETKKDQVVNQFREDSKKTETLKLNSTSNPINKNNDQVAKKRVNILMSVPLGESVNEKKKNQIMSKFLKKAESTESTIKNVAVATNEGLVEKMEVDDANK